VHTPRKIQEIPDNAECAANTLVGIPRTVTTQKSKMNSSYHKAAASSVPANAQLLDPSPSYIGDTGGGGGSGAGALDDAESGHTEGAYPISPSSSGAEHPIITMKHRALRMAGVTFEEAHAIDDHNLATEIGIGSNSFASILDCHCCCWARTF
jgi:hypothetical protein